MITSESIGVYKAICNVQEDLSKIGIAKGRVNSFDKYKFRGIDDIYNVLAPLLSKHGLVILPRAISRTLSERATQKGGISYSVVMHMEYDFISAGDGSKHTVTAYGEAMDRGDKATPKAVSAAYKYMLFQAFCIPVEGQPDADDGDHALSGSPATISAERAAEVVALAEQTETDLAKLCAAYKVSSASELTESAYNNAMRILKQRAAQ